MQKEGITVRKEADITIIKNKDGAIYSEAV
jgi:hypothetical protein